MLLSSGTRLGPYEVIAALGAGGMGEVYRARDTRLGRDVAIKVLPRHLSSNPEVRARFEREAKTVSSLNHPNICVLHDVGRENDTDYLVMELIEGETLARRLAKGPLPLADVLRLGAQIAEALSRAHRAGVVHRDLKPGNVMLAGANAKLMDFGLARATGLAGPAGGSGATVLALTQSPTVAQPLTAEGTIVGTFQYMAPEQLEGREADARSDVWGLGCVLYEMATGRRAFDGASQASLISAIMKEDPRPIAEVAPLAPAALDRLVRGCLAKDPEQRIQSAHDVKLLLDGIREDGSQPGVPVPRPAMGSGRERLLWLGALATVALGAVAAVLLLRGGGEAPRAVHATLSPPAGVEYSVSSVVAIPLAVSPDGTRIAFCAMRGDTPDQLWVRSLGAADARALDGTEGAELPFFSPDGRSVAFFANRKLRKVAVDGGPVIDLADVSAPRGGSWGRGGTIVFSPGSNSPLFEVPEDGGTVRQVTTLDTLLGEDTHRYPHWLPDGKQFLYLARRSGAGAGEQPTIYAAAPGAKSRKAVVQVASNVVFASGQLLYARGGILLAQPFDPARLATTGPPSTVIEDLQWDERFSRGVFAASGNGVLACLTGDARKLTQLEWRDRGGARLGRIGEPAEYTYGGTPNVSPDGTRAAMCVQNGARGISEVWTVDLASGRRSRVTLDDSDHAGCAWSHDGRGLLVQSSAGTSGRNEFAILKAGLDGSARDTVMTYTDWIWPLSVSPDGRSLLVSDDGGAGGSDLSVVATDGSRRMTPLAAGPALERQGQFSPDGRWVAYTSYESGPPEVYVVSFPGPGGRWQVSESGGLEPRWGRDGRELFYVDARNQLTAVRVVASESGFESGPATVLFPLRATSGDWRYDVAPGGARFLTMAPADGQPNSPITVLTDWTSRLRK